VGGRRWTEAKGTHNAIWADFYKGPFLAIGEPLKQVELRVIHDVRRVRFWDPWDGLLDWRFGDANLVCELESVPLEH
jgi:hypothetical protein